MPHMPHPSCYTQLGCECIRQTWSAKKIKSSRPSLKFFPWQIKSAAALTCFPSGIPMFCSLGASFIFSSSHPSWFLCPVPHVVANVGFRVYTEPSQDWSFPTMWQDIPVQLSHTPTLRPFTKLLMWEKHWLSTRLKTHAHIVLRNCSQVAWLVYLRLGAFLLRQKIVSNHCICATCTRNILHFTTLLRYSTLYCFVRHMYTVYTPSAGDNISSWCPIHQFGTNNNIILIICAAHVRRQRQMKATQLVSFIFSPWQFPDHSWLGQVAPTGSESCATNRCYSLQLCILEWYPTISVSNRKASVQPLWHI
jgi:hypothetical protein